MRSCKFYAAKDYDICNDEILYRLGWQWFKGKKVVTQTIILRAHTAIEKRLALASISGAVAVLKSMGFKRYTPDGLIDLKL
jgi:hypothetical protein